MITQHCCLCCSFSQVHRTAWFLVIPIIIRLTRSSSVSWEHVLTHLLDPARITQVRDIQLHFNELQWQGKTLFTRRNLIDLYYIH